MWCDPLTLCGVTLDVGIAAAAAAGVEEDAASNGRGVMSLRRAHDKANSGGTRARARRGLRACEPKGGRRYMYLSKLLY